jgi:hypothetical protein
MKTLINFLKLIFTGYLSAIGSIVSIIGLIVTFLSKEYAVIIALCSFVIFLIILLFRMFFVMKTFLLQKTLDGSHRFATYIRYSTEDGRHISYEIHKYVQCKSIIMNEHVHKFYWTGSKSPVITSELQEVGNLQKKEDAFDEIILRFRKPLAYNEFAIIHLKMDLDDTDKAAKPFLEIAVKEALQLINFRIELRHVDAYHSAKVSKKKIDSQIAKDELIKFIPFDKSAHSYEYIINNPMVGYKYKIDWAEHPE